MKKGLLLFLGMLMMVSTVEATDGKKSNSTKDYFSYNRSQPIKFMERGIKFYVFPNGEVDFNTNTRSRTRYYYRNGRRYKKRIPHIGVAIDRDFYGRIRRVGNVFINYNRYGNVTRVGSVFIDYHRGRKLKRVGGLTIRYDRYGRVRYYGQVKPRFGIGFNNYHYEDFIYDYNDDFFYHDDFYNYYDDYDEDDDYFYYKSKSSKGLKKGHKKGKIIKRKKLKKDFDRDDDYKERKRRK
ncbi:MAG: hypothetical protein HKN90_06610 [Flavobacteriaceae bacterium]|nr:hypothetical protein [Flavobacteriaceae bacterium]